MKISHHIYLKSAVMLLAISSLLSCIKESTEGCEPQDIRRSVLINYSYMPKNDYKGIDREDVKKITLYAFDADGVFVEKFIENPQGFNSDYSKTIYLEPGKYTFVTWFNQENPFSTTITEFTPSKLSLTRRYYKWRELLTIQSELLYQHLYTQSIPTQRY